MARPSQKQPQTAKAHSYWKSWLNPGQIALDATAGNGHDTLALAKTVGTGGKVIAVDRQPSAIHATRNRLAEAGWLDRVELHCGSHHQPELFLPDSLIGQIALAVFNLGYLPGGDTGLTTLANTTLQSLNNLRPWMAAQHMLSIITYPGHPEGLEEHQAFQTWLNQNRPRYQAIWQNIPPTKKSRPPILTILIAFKP